MKRIIVALLLLGGHAWGQSSPGWTNGYVPPASEWNSTWASKQNNGGPISMQSPGVLSVLSNTPLEGVYATGAGPFVSMCPGYDFGCNTAINKIMAEFASITTTLGDAGTQEAGINAYLVNKTGEALPWVASHAYTSGKNSISDSGQNLYVETVASCTSAASGGPTGTGTAIVDGTCRWDYNGNPGLRGKMAIVGTTLVLPGGTDAWAGDFDTFIEPGWLEGFATGMEIDVTNLSGRDATGLGGGAPTINDLYLGGSVGTQPITSYIGIAPFGLMGTNYMAHDGVFIQGQYTIKDHDFRVSTHSQVAFFDDALSVHGTASYFDASTSPSGILLEGVYSSGNAMVANSQIQAIKAAAGANFSGFNVTNSGTTASTTAASATLNTGNTNSFARFDLFDSSGLSISTGSAIATGITLATAAGPINLNPATTLKINGTSAVSCASGTVSAATMVVIAGIVTHC